VVLINFTQLKTFVAVVRHGSFAEAARELGYSPSAVSQQIAALEKMCKIELFERRAHSVYPTPAAREIAERTNMVLVALDDLRDRMRVLSQSWSGSIRVGAFSTASLHLMPATVRIFVGRFPRTEVLLDEGRPAELLQALVARDLDVALVYSYGLAEHRWREKVLLTELYREQMLLLLPEQHRLAKSSRVSITDLRDETWVASHEGTPGADLLAALTASAGVSPRIGFRTNDHQIIERLVSERVGVALIPAQGYVPMPGVRPVSLADPDAVRRVYAAVPVGEDNPIVSAFVDAMGEAVAGLIARDDSHTLTMAPPSPG